MQEAAWDSGHAVAERDAAAVSGRVERVAVGTTDLIRMRRKWNDLLEPIPMNTEDEWQLRAGPAITLVEHPCNLLVRLEIGVESLAKAREFLAGNDLLGEESSTELTLNPTAVDGLDIRLVIA